MDTLDIGTKFLLYLGMLVLFAIATTIFVFRSGKEKKA